MEYSIRMIEEESPDEGTHWYADHPALQGCHAIAPSQGEALEELDEARESWLAVAARHGGEIPPEEEFPMTQVHYLRKPGVEVSVAAHHDKDLNIVKV